MAETTHIVCPQCDGVNRVPVERLGQSPKCGKCGTELFQGNPLSLDGQRFYNHIHKSDIPVLVDFWAPWCGPCRTMAPSFEQAAAKLEPRVRLLKVNTEENQQIAAEYVIRSIPSLLLFEAGNEVARIAGAMDLGGLMSWVEDNL